MNTATRFMQRWALRFPDFNSFKCEYSVRGVRPIMWHLTREAAFEVRLDWRPGDVPGGRAGGQARPHEGPGLMLTAYPASWPERALGRRDYVAAIDITDLEPGRDYTVVSRGYDEIWVDRPEKVRLLKVYGRRQGLQRAAALWRDYPQSEREQLQIWESVRV